MQNKIITILQERDGLSLDAARLELREARQAVAEGEDPAEVLEDFFGLEPDYLFDLI